MIRITTFQLYAILAILIGPFAFLEVPKRMLNLLHNNAWLATAAAIVPGLLIILMFEHIISKSTRPFPLLLEEHLGPIPGKILAFLYIPVFLVICAFTLRLFVDFVDSNVLPQTPLSIFIAAILLIGYLGIKSGFTQFARICEIIIYIELSFSFVILLLPLIQKPAVENILPVGFMNIKDFIAGTTSTATIMGRVFPVLTLAFFVKDRSTVGPTLRAVLYTFIMLMTLTTVVTTFQFGGDFASTLTFPTFTLVRMINIGDFLTNLDIFFIGIWILGIFGALTIPWFISCYTTQQLFRLKGYSFIAAPTALIIGVTSLLMSRNILELKVLTEHIMIYIYALFLIVIPFLVFLITLFKPPPDSILPEPPRLKEL